MDDKEQKYHIIEMLNTFDLYGCKLIKLGNALSTLILFDEKGSASLIENIKNFIKVVFFRSKKVEIKGEGKIAFCFSHSYSSRKDYEIAIRKVISTTENTISIFSISKFRFSLRRLISSVNVILWVRQLGKTKLELSTRIRYAIFILDCYNYCREIYGVLKNYNPNLIVTFCDVHPNDYFVVNLYNQKQIPTATLQHAMFSYNDYAFANAFSESKYFLGIDDYSKMQYELSRGNADNFVTVGAMKYIGVNLHSDYEIRNTGYIGVVLSGINFMSENEYLLDYSKRLAIQKGKKLLIRFHPSIKREKLRNILDKNNFEIDSSTNFEEFARKADYYLVGTTNCFGDLISDGAIAFRLVLNNDRYEGINDFHFSSYDELVFLTEYQMQKDFGLKFQNVRKYVCAKGNIFANYRNFFEMFQN